jgi:uncharacterized membrane protein (UPF0127 family)
VLVAPLALGVALLAGAAYFAVASRDDDHRASAGLGLVVTDLPEGAPSWAAGFRATRLSVDGPCADVLVADTPALRNQGLRAVTDLSPWAGMLFIRAVPEQTAFTMAGTATDLSIGWYDGDGHRLGAADMVVCDGTDETCPLYPSPSPWTYALEYPAGTLPDGDLAAC